MDVNPGVWEIIVDRCTFQDWKDALEMGMKSRIALAFVEGVFAQRRNPCAVYKKLLKNGDDKRFAMVYEELSVRAYSGSMIHTSMP
jgi:hypothetical protein